MFIFPGLLFSKINSQTASVRASAEAAMQLQKIAKASQESRKLKQGKYCSSKEKYLIRANQGESSSVEEFEILEIENSPLQRTI